jgi:hypothetical protein
VREMDVVGLNEKLVALWSAAAMTVELFPIRCRWIYSRTKVLQDQENCGLERALWCVMDELTSQGVAINIESVALAYRKGELLVKADNAPSEPVPTSAPFSVPIGVASKPRMGRPPKDPRRAAAIQALKNRGFSTRQARYLTSKKLS